MSKQDIYIGDVLEQLDNVKSGSVDLIITDPPYGVLKEGKTGWGLGYKPADWDVFSSPAKFRAFTEQWFELAKTKLKSDSFMFIFWSQKYLPMGYEIFKPHRTLIWRYNNLINSPKGDFSYDYEPIFVVKVGKPRLKNTSRAVLEFSKPQSNFKVDKAVYPTQKPRALINHLLTTVGLQPGQVVMDCFQGSGVVGEQATLLGLDYIGIDKSLDSEITSKALISESLRTLQPDAQQITMFKEIDEQVVTKSLQSTVTDTGEIHYFETVDSSGKTRKYKRKLSGLWYERDCKLLLKDIAARGETLVKDYIQ